MSGSKTDEAFKLITSISQKALDAQLKKDSIVCLMVEDPDNLGAALVCQFLITATKGSAKTMKQYTTQKAIELMSERRI